MAAASGGRDRDDPNREIEAALERMGAPAPRDPFRDELRAAFVRSSSRELEGRRTGSPVDERLEERIRHTAAETPAARPAFRAGLRRDFVSADVGAGADSVEADAKHRPISPFRKALVFTLAAAAAILVTIFVPSDPVWSLREAPGVGPVEVAGVSIGKAQLGASDRKRIGVELARGGRVVSGERELALELQETLRIRVRAGTTVEFDALPALDTAEPIVLQLTRGELFLETLPGYPGNPILVQTEDATVSVTGTVLGVLVDDKGTCTCVARGAVYVDDRSGQSAAERVTAGRSYLLFHGGAMAPKDVEFEPEGDEAHIAHTRTLAAFAVGGSSGS